MIITSQLIKNSFLNTKELIISFLLSAFIHYIIFWNEILRRFGSHANWFIIVFLMCLLLTLFVFYKINKDIKFVKFIVIAVCIPYILSVLGYLGVIIHSLSVYNKVSGDFVNLLFPIFLFSYAAIKGWYLTIYLIILGVLNHCYFFCKENNNDNILLKNVFSKLELLCVVISYTVTSIALVVAVYKKYFSNLVNFGFEFLLAFMINAVVFFIWFVLWLFFRKKCRFFLHMVFSFVYMFTVFAITNNR